MKLFAAIIKLSGALCVLLAVLGFILGLSDHVIEINRVALPLIDGGTAVVLIVIGLVMFFGGFFLEKRAVRNSPENAVPQLELSNLDFIEKAIRRTRRRNYIIGFCMIVFGVLFVCVPFLDPEADPSSGGSIFIFVLAAVMITVGGWMLIKAIQLNNIQDSSVYQTIMLEPKTITGLNAHIVRSAYTKHSTQINANLLVGTKKIAMLNVKAEELELLRQYLVKHNPNLEFTTSEQVVS